MRRFGRAKVNIMYNLQCISYKTYLHMRNKSSCAFKGSRLKLNWVVDRFPRKWKSFRRYIVVTWPKQLCRLSIYHHHFFRWLSAGISTIFSAHDPKRIELAFGGYLYIKFIERNFYYFSWFSSERVLALFVVVVVFRPARARYCSWASLDLIAGFTFDSLRTSKKAK
jgi:hypothetical protein